MEEKIEQRERQIRASSEIDRGVLRRPARERLQAARALVHRGQRRHAAARAQAEDGDAPGAPRRSRAASSTPGRGAGPSSEMSTEELLAADVDDHEEK
jgi:hypothetical protein